ncbi:neuronatin isoform X1 [Oryctolagus cuniculus]|uniref:neuronatin isoform X1 n=1 Tax=Oryctolagus cuniculus TaxID=9986 RepID=UPI00387A48DF
MAAVAAASAELLIIGWYIFRVLLQVSVSRLPVGTCSPCAHPTPANPRRDCRLPSPSYPDCRDPCPIAAAGIACPPPVPCALLLAQTLPSAPAPGREQRLGRGGRLPRTIAEAFSYLRGAQVLPAEAGVHGVADRAAGAGGAQAESPQLRPQLPALGGRVIRCSCPSQPAWEPVPRRNGGSPVLPRQRSTCQGQ